MRRIIYNLLITVLYFETSLYIDLESIIAHHCECKISYWPSNENDRIRNSYPIISRWIVGPNYSHLLPMSMVIGVFFMLVVDDLSRTIAATEIPLGILTSGRCSFVCISY